MPAWLQFPHLSQDHTKTLGKNYPAVFNLSNNCSYTNELYKPIICVCINIVFINLCVVKQNQIQLSVMVSSLNLIDAYKGQRSLMKVTK